jgi:tubulin-specific chaperone C
MSDLQEQMGRLGDTALIGGERTDAIEHLVAGIARLGTEVGDASSYLPAYDQRTYGEVRMCMTCFILDKARLLTKVRYQAIKGLREKLEETRASFGPRTRFTFKTARKTPSAISLSDAAELAAQKRLALPGYETASSGSSFVNTPNYMRTPNRNSSPAPYSVPPPTAVSDSSKDASDNEKKENKSLETQKAVIRRPTFSTSSTVSITRESTAHIILPSSASHASKPCSLTSLKGCVVDISVLSPEGSAPFAGLTIKNVKGSLLVCGTVSGPAHITSVEDSVIVVTCRQFRMHECKKVDVYLSCSSRPIIEDCSGIRFAQLPDTYVNISHSIHASKTTPMTNHILQRIPSSQPQPPPLENTTNNTTTQPSSPPDLWSSIDDFKWLKPTPSPNWSLLPTQDTVRDDTWRKIVPGGPGRSLEDILTAVRVLR